MTSSAGSRPVQIRSNLVPLCSIRNRSQSHCNGSYRQTGTPCKCVCIQLLFLQLKPTAFWAVVAKLQELRDFVKQLLVRKPAYRLGEGAGGPAAIKKHPWFNGFDWDAFSARKLKAPYMPVVSFMLESWRCAGSGARHMVSDSKCLLLASSTWRISLL